MNFNLKHLRPEGKLALTAAIIIALFLFYILLFHPPDAGATKTTRLELREVGGSYDGNVVLTRDSDGNFLFTTPSGTVKIKDGNIILSGNIIVDGEQIGVTMKPDLLKLLSTQLSVDGHLHVYQNIYSGKLGTNGYVIVKNSSDEDVIILQGSTGDAFFNGGLNVGTPTGAPTGSGYFYGTKPHLWLKDTSASGDLAVSYVGFFDSNGDRIGYVGDGLGANSDIYLVSDSGSVIFRTGILVRALINASTGNIDAFYGINVGTATGAATGDIKASGDLDIAGGDIIGANGVEVDLGELVAGRAYLKANRLVMYTIDGSRGNLEYSEGTGTAAINVYDDDEDTILYLNNSHGSYELSMELEGFISTDGNEFLSTDIIRHTILSGEATAGFFIETWNTATVAKVVSITTGLNNGGTVFRNQAATGMYTTFSASGIEVNEGPIAWVPGNIVTIKIVYEQ